MKVIEEIGQPNRISITDEGDDLVVHQEIGDGLSLEHRNNQVLP